MISARFLMPFSANRAFKSSPRLVVGGKGMILNLRMAVIYWMACLAFGVSI